MKNFLALIFVVTWIPLSAKTIEIKCAGKIFLYTQDVLELEVKDIAFDFDGKRLGLRSSLPGFFEGPDQQELLVVRRNHSDITLMHPSNSRFTGGINRQTGEIFFRISSVLSENQMSSIFIGFCE